MAFYDVFERLCAKKGVTPIQVARDNGIAQSSIATWKKRGSTPKAETVQKLADYFGVSVDYLLKESNPFTKGSEEFCAYVKRTLANRKKSDYEIFGMLGTDSGRRVLMQMDLALAKLNPDGQQEAVKRVEELTEIPRYQAKKEQK